MLIFYSVKDGAKVISGSLDHTVRVWDMATGREVHKLEGHSDPIWSVAISPVQLFELYVHTL